MNSIVEFLAAQLDTEEALAQAAGSTRSGKIASWRVACEHADVHPDSCYECRVEGDNITIYDEGGHDEDQARHIARHDPVRVLAEVAAKRAIIQIHAPEDVETGDDGRLGTVCDNCDYEPWPCQTVFLLTLPYADHPDYDESWRI